jgi:hypothetical protein
VLLPTCLQNVASTSASPTHPGWCRLRPHSPPPMSTLTSIPDKLLRCQTLASPLLLSPVTSCHKLPCTAWPQTLCPQTLPASSVSGSCYFQLLCSKATISNSSKTMLCASAQESETSLGNTEGREKALVTITPKMAPGRQELRFPYYFFLRCLSRT